MCALEEVPKGIIIFSPVSAIRVRDTQRWVRVRKKFKRFVPVLREIPAEECQETLGHFASWEVARMVNQFCVRRLQTTCEERISYKVPWRDSDGAMGTLSSSKQCHCNWDLSPCWLLLQLQKYNVPFIGWSTICQRVSYIAFVFLRVAFRVFPCPLRSSSPSVDGWLIQPFRM